MDKNNKLEVGEKYLNVQILRGKVIPCFKNKNKKNSNEPDYKGDGVAIWITKKQEPKTIKQIQETEYNVSFLHEDF